MGAVKTRCRECLYANNQVTQEPCNKCGEIQHSIYKYDSNFIPANKNLMGVKINE
jgi:hypothetical protein